MKISDKARLSTLLKNISEIAGDYLRGAYAPHPAPERIRAAVMDYESERERIIGWIQLAGVALFAALYVATYNAFEFHQRVEPAPFALAFYGVFTLWRLRRSYRGSLSAGFRYVSAALDVIVLMALIAAFPLQYDQRAALYLKVPTLFYDFILICLRALRFDPALVLMTGVLSAAGRGALFVKASVDGAPFTGDYRIYMQSLSLLPGAELEKIAAILAVSGILAMGVASAFPPAATTRRQAPLRALVWRGSAPAGKHCTPRRLW